MMALGGSQAEAEWGLIDMVQVGVESIVKA